MFVRALVDLGLVEFGAELSAVRTSTQAHVGGDGCRGVVDLVVELELGGGLRSFWVEVKAHAGLHGPQIQVYLDAASGHPGDPVVVMLCKRPLTDAVPTIRWNSLREHSRCAAHVYWHDLRRFLEENRMADGFDHPITPAELEVVPAARSLLRKTARMAYEFICSLPEGDWKQAEFPEAESKALAAVTRQFRKHGRLVVGSKRYPWVNFGLTFNPSPRLEVWVEFKPRDLEARDVVFALARSKGLLGGWSLRPGGWAALAASTPVEGVLDQEFALGWLTERFSELGDADVFAELPRWRLRNRLGDLESEDDEG